MAEGRHSKDQAHGAPSSPYRTLKFANRLVFTAALLYTVAVSDGCGASDGALTHELLQGPPWSLFVRTQCPPSSSPEVMLGKRSQQDRISTAPCTCDTQVKTLDLGNLRFPRYLPSVDCRVAASECSYGILCRPRTYKVRVLRRRIIPTANGEEGDDEDYSEEDDSLPPSLRSTWRLEEHSINFACECKSFKLSSGKL